MINRPEGAGAPGSASSPPDVVIVGSASRDLAADDPRGWRLGGGVTYAALACARLGCRTGAVIGLDPLARTAQELDLMEAAGVQLVRVPLPHGPVFRNVEAQGGRVQTCLDPGTPVAPGALPAAWRGAPAWILAPVAGELDEAWAEPIPSPAFVALGWQGLLRSLVAGASVARRAPAAGGLVGRADLVSVSRHDIGPELPTEELARFLRPGAWLAITDGAAGGLVAEVTAGGLGRVVGYRASVPLRELDPTGAGDTFLAALVARAMRPEERGHRIGRPLPGSIALRGAVPDVRFAAAAASFTVEEPGLAGVPDRAAVLGRLGDPAAQSFADPPSSST